jgi:hypothetical protein
VGKEIINVHSVTRQTFPSDPGIQPKGKLSTVSISSGPRHVVGEAGYPRTARDRTLFSLEQSLLFDLSQLFSPISYSHPGELGKTSREVTNTIYTATEGLNCHSNSGWGRRKGGKSWLGQLQGCEEGRAL